MKIPLGPIPPSYRTYALTSVLSEVPLSHYVAVPLQRFSPSVPHSLFLHPSTPRRYVAWESSSHPLVCFHLTYFPAEGTHPSHTCIGFARCHGVFDGVGAAAVMRAIAAEMKGRDWDIPILPCEGLNMNPVQMAMDWEVAARDRQGQGYPGHGGYSVLGIGGSLKTVGWHVREKWWRGAVQNILILPKRAHDRLIGRVRADLERLSGEPGKVSTGDILVAWLLKVGLALFVHFIRTYSWYGSQVVYSSGTSASRMVHCSNFASFRSILSMHDDAIQDYPHNAFAPLPYPVFSVGDLNRLRLHELAHCLAVSRLSFSMSDVVSAYHTLSQSPLAMPIHPDTEETLYISNVSASRIMETDWSPFGGQKTICGYRYTVTPTELPLTNAAYISGRLGDSSVVLDVMFSKPRLALLAAEVENLIRDSD